MKHYPRYFGMDAADGKVYREIAIFDNADDHGLKDSKGYFLIHEGS